MNFNEFANKYFDSDKSKALQQLVIECFSEEYTYTKSDEENRKIISNLDKAAAYEYMKYYSEFAKKNSEYYSKWFSARSYRNLVKMDRNEILSCQKNPFSKNLKIFFLLCIAAIVFFVIVSICANHPTPLPQNERTLFHISSLVIIVPLAFFSLFYANRFRRFKKFKNITIEKSKFVLDFNFDSNDNPTVDDLVARSLLSNEPYNGPKEPLNTETIVRIFNATHKFYRNGYIAFGVSALVVILMLLGSASLTFAAILLVIPGIPFVSFCIAKTATFKKVNNLNFHIVTDKCIKKKDVYDSEDHSYDGAKFEFENYGELRIPSMSGSSDGEISSFVKLTERSIKENDECYLVILDGQKKILFAFPKNRYVIDSHEFSLGENGYIPTRKN